MPKHAVMRCWLLFVLALFLPKAYAQTKDTTSKFLFSFESRNSFIRGQKAVIQALKVGSKRRNNWNIGLAICFLENPIKKEHTFEDIANYAVRGRVELRFHYYAVWLEYIWLKNFRWDISTAYHIGLGTIEIRYFPYDLSSFIPPERKSTGVNEIFFSVLYRLHRYLGLGTGAGIRSLITTREILSQSLDSPLYHFRIKLFLSEIFNDIKKLKNPLKKNQPSITLNYDGK